MTLKHYFEKGQIYFVTSVTHQREPLLVNPISARFLLVTIAYHKFLLEFNLFGYVVMPDHFHILVQLSDKYPLSKIMNFIKGNFSRKYNQIFQRKEPVWQRRYYESGLRSMDSVLDRLKYMHNNPVKKGLVSEPAEYEFSSYHQYYGSPRQKIQIPIDRSW